GLVTVSATGTVTSVGPLGQAVVRISSVGTSLTQDATLTISQLTSPTGESTQTITAPLIYAVRAFASDSVIGVSYNGVASVITLASGAVRSFPVAKSFGVGVATGRGRIYTSSENGNVYEQNLTTGTSRSLPVDGQLFDLVVDAHEQFAYAGVEAGKVAIIDLTQWKVTEQITTGTSGLHLTISADGTKLYASGGSVVQIDLAHGNATHTLPNLGAQATAVSSDGRYVYTFPEGGPITKFDLTTDLPVATWDLPGCAAWGAAISPDDRVFLISCPSQGSAVLVDVSNGAILKTFPSIGEGRRVTFSADGALGFIGTSEGLFIVR
ncbi:MAG: hypothetical protein ABI877_09590, partial [Gemmatimonadaceae bacterium]